MLTFRRIRAAQPQKAWRRINQAHRNGSLRMAGATEEPKGHFDEDKNQNGNGSESMIIQLSENSI